MASDYQGRQRVGVHGFFFPLFRTSSLIKGDFTPYSVMKDDKLLGHLMSDEPEIKCHSPLEAMMARWPSLLVKLLEKGTHISLERLQLLYCDIELRDSEAIHEGFANVELAREIKEGHRFIKLKGQWRSYAVTLTYGERGARKYHKPSLCTNAMAFKTLDAPSACEIREFLISIDQDNSFFYDDKVRELNGFPAHEVPTQMVMALLAKWTLNSKPVLRYSYTFAKALLEKEPIVLSLLEEADRTTIKVEAQGQGVAQLILNFA